MMLVLTILAPLLGAAAALRAGRRAPTVAMLSLGTAFIFLLDAWLRRSGSAPWAAEIAVPWIAPLGAQFRLALDGLALALSLLTVLLGMAGLSIASREIKTNLGAFCALYLAALAGILGVFLAQDLFLFFVFYEVMLVPAYFLLTHWGDDKQGRAATTFFIFTQTSGLVLLVSIVALAGIHASGGGPLTFDPLALQGTADGTAAGTLIVLGFLIAFAVKLPIVPFHTWQAPTYASAPASVGILLAGLMSKAGAYGIVRFAVPLLPESAFVLAPAAIILACISLVYCAVLAFGQRDIKRLIAYSSAGHLAFIVLGVFSFGPLGYAGVVAMMIAHAMSVSSLFILAGHLEQATGSRDFSAFGGVWKSAPRTGAIAIIIAMATLGLPGLGNFVGEFLVLVSIFATHPIAAAVGAAGAVLSAIYSLMLLQRAFLGQPAERHSPAIGEAPTATLAVLSVLVAALLWLGIHPQPLLDLTAPSANPMMIEIIGVDAATGHAAAHTTEGTRVAQR